MSPLLAAGVAFGVTTLALPVVIVLLRRAAVLDVPGARSSHVVTTVRGGGAALVVGMLAGFATAPAVGPVVAVATFGLLGLADDLRGLPVGRRFVAQLVLGAVVAALVLTPLAPSWSVLVAGIGVIAVWTCAFVNAFNFMDGINGISGMHGVLAGAAFALLGLWAAATTLVLGGLVLAAVSLAFLPFNAVRARCFLGDVGSYALGAVLAVLVVVAVLAGVPVETAVAPVALYLADTGWTLVRRVRAGEDWRQAHRSHVYQRLCDVGGTHPRVALATAGVSAAVVAASALSLTGRPELRLLGVVVGAVVLVAYLASPARLAVRAPIRSGVA